LDQEREPRDVVLVRMGQNEDVDPSVPRREPLVERDEQAVRIGPAVDEQSAAARALDEDRVTLPDVQDDERRRPVRPVDEDEAAERDGTGERADGGPSCPGTWARRAGRRARVGWRSGSPTARRVEALPDERPGPRRCDQGE